MTVSRPPMGFNTWNTFGAEISEQLIIEIADKLVELGYLAITPKTPRSIVVKVEI